MNVKTLGDTHLGRVFHNGVPLHRRGDRERMVWAQFERELNDVEGVDVHIQMGDLFDKFQVSPNVVYRAAMMYRTASAAHPDVLYCINRGNHDASRDLERVSAYQMFAMMVGTEILVVEDKPIRIGNKLRADGEPGIVVIPWHPVLNATELVMEHAAEIQWTYGGVAYGHWDVVDIVNDKENMIPARLLSSLGVTRAVTGHDHNARELVIDGLPVTVTGSMQPYSHAEDPDEQIYVTRSLAEVLADPDAYKDKALRIVLGPTEVLDTPIDCLQLQVGREKDAGAEAIQVEFEVFDFDALYSQAVAEIGMTPAMATIVQERIEAERVARS